MKPKAWVPPGIADHYERIMNGDDGSTWKSGPYGWGSGLIFEYGYPKAKLKPVICDLCTHWEMEGVWAYLSQAFAGPEHRGWENDFFKKHLLFAMFSRSPWDHLTPKDREQQLRDVLKAARKLAALLRKYEVDETVWDLMAPGEFEGAIERHYYTGFTPGYQNSDIEGHREPGLFLCQNPPFITDLLDRLAKKHDGWNPNDTALAMSKGKYGVDYLIFARRMATYLKERITGESGEVIAKNVGALVRALINDKVSDDTVRKTIKGAPHDKEGLFSSWKN